MHDLLQNSGSVGTAELLQAVVLPPLTEACNRASALRNGISKSAAPASDGCAGDFAGTGAGKRTADVTSPGARQLSSWRLAVAAAFRALAFTEDANNVCGLPALFFAASHALKNLTCNVHAYRPAADVETAKPTVASDVERANGMDTTGGVGSGRIDGLWSCSRARRYCGLIFPVLAAWLQRLARAAHHGMMLRFLWTMAAGTQSPNQRDTVRTGREARLLFGGLQREISAGAPKRSATDRPLAAGATSHSRCPFPPLPSLLCACAEYSDASSKSSGGRTSTEEADGLFVQVEDQSPSGNANEKDDKKGNEEPRDTGCGHGHPKESDSHSSVTSEPSIAEDRCGGGLEAEVAVLDAFESFLRTMVHVGAATGSGGTGFPSADASLQSVLYSLFNEASSTAGAVSTVLAETMSASLAERELDPPALALLAKVLRIRMVLGELLGMKIADRVSVACGAYPDFREASVSVQHCASALELVGARQFSLARYDFDRDERCVDFEGFD